MPTPPTPRYTDLSDFESYANVNANSTAKSVVLPRVLVAAEKMVERYCRRRFAPEPVLADPKDGHQRRVVEVNGPQGALAAGGVPPVSGSLAFSFDGHTTPPLTLPIAAAQLEAAFTALSSVGAGNATAAGGPLPTWPVSITFAGTLTGAQAAITVDSTGLLGGGYASVIDMGFDSLPPVVKRFTTRGRTVIRVPDLRIVDAAPDPAVPNSGGVWLYGRRLLPNQYYLGANAYASGGADETIGTGDYAEPSTEVTLGFGYGSGYSLAAQFSFTLPLGYRANDLAIAGRWGWNPVPDEIINAVYAVASRTYRERDAAFSDQMITQEGAVFQYFKQLPASIQATLDTYRVPNIGLIGAGGA